MDVLLWLAAPLGVTAVAACVAGWRARPRRTQGSGKTTAAYARFQEALQRPRSARAVRVVAQRDTTRKAVALRPARREEEVSGYRPAGLGGQRR